MPEYRISVEGGFTKQLAMEAEARGFLGGVNVEVGFKKHTLFFYDPVRLSQDLEAESKQGRPFIAERGLIVVRKVTWANIEFAIDSLARRGFFD